MKEHALKFGTNGSLIGVLTEGENVDATGKVQGDSAALLFNAGLVHHVGPNRFYVKLARRLAAMGMMVLRFDFSGIGDSAPRMDKLPADASKLDDARQAIDMLEDRWNIKTFICIGLCAGAATAVQVSVADLRVKKLILINPMFARTNQTELMRGSRYYYTYALSNPRSWLKFISLKSNYRGVWKAVWMNTKTKFRPNAVRENELPQIISELEVFFRHLNTAGVRVLLFFSEHEIGERYIQSVIGHEYNKLKESGLIRTEILIGSDHQVTPLACQKNVLESVSGWLNETV